MRVRQEEPENLAEEKEAVAQYGSTEARQTISAPHRPPVEVGSTGELRLKEA